MKITSPIYLSLVALAALGLGMPLASAADNEASEIKDAPRVIHVHGEHQTQNKFHMTSQVRT